MTVYLVGAGPGDPGLLTVRGAEVLARADVVVYDRLSVAALLDLAPVHALRISVAKQPGAPSTSQEEINTLLVEHGAAGLEVVRLKGGDPFVFARGGEEARALLDAGVPFEVVPGISSAIAAPAYAGIPVTLRHSSTSFTVVTGHEDPVTGVEGSVDWDAVARVGGTIIILMGVARMAAIAERLIAAGRSPDTPAAAVQWGTRPEQRTVRATLATLADQDLASPSTIVVGEVAAEDLAWFTERPLFGQTVVVTRPESQAGTLADGLRAAGALAVVLPVIEIEDPGDGGVALAAALTEVQRYDWLVVTSANGAQRVLAGLADARALGGVAVAAIGPGTAAALADGNIRADLVPERFVAESLLEAFPAPPDGGGRVLLARAAVARDTLPDGLRAAGWDVDVIEAYRTVPARPAPALLDAAASADVVTFTSSSTVTRYLEVAGADRVPPIVACIGPVTAATAREAGLTVTVEATQHTIPGLVQALIDHVSAARVSLQALVFDFDGLILDTEWSAYSTAAAVWEEHGIELDLAVWQGIVGTAEHVHWSEMLETDLGRAIDRDTVIPTRQAQHHVEVEAMDLLPGAEDLIRAAGVAGLHLAVASSSPHDWVGGHLERRGLIGYFDTVVCREDVARTKPDPALYSTAVERLGVDPARAVALEDSHHGTVAAKAAGLACVAVPNRVTTGQDFGAASLIVDSLADLTIPTLEALTT